MKKILIKNQYLSSNLQILGKEKTQYFKLEETILCITNVLTAS